VAGIVAVTSDRHVAQPAPNIQVFHIYDSTMHQLATRLQAVLSM